MAFQVGDRVRVLHTEWQGEVIELRGALAPGGVMVYRIAIDDSELAPEFREDQLAHPQRQELVQRAQRRLAIARIAATKGDTEGQREALREARRLYELAGCPGMVNFCDRWL